jgi:hypothetical protein
VGKHSKILDSWKGYTTIGISEVPVYHVIKSSKYGVFHGTVMPCPQDYDNINDWDGYRFAERKCDIDIIHARSKVLKERAQGILNAHKTLFDKYKATKNYDMAPALADLYYQYELAQKEYKRVYEQYKYMRDSFPDYTTRMIERRKQLNNKIKEQRNKANEE